MNAKWDENMSPEEKVNLVFRHVKQLSEHFDSVQIFVSRFDPVSEATETVVLGDGNFYARLGQIIEWLNHQEARDISEKENEDEPQ